MGVQCLGQSLWALDTGGADGFDHRQDVRREENAIESAISSVTTDQFVVVSRRVRQNVDR